mmetsp:Transcript_45730/g.178049  ORF Transcript_45730/g.178049 Transcript_45730/m.178049 type:complete len:211 (-) Transcript_45730:296-928(-)
MRVKHCFKVGRDVIVQIVSAGRLLRGVSFRRIIRSLVVVNIIHLEIDEFAVALVRPWENLENMVKGNIQVGALLLGYTHVVGIDGPDNRVVSNNEHWLPLPFQLEDYGLNSLNDVDVAFALRIPVPQFVLLPCSRDLRHFFLDFIISHPFAFPRVNFVKRPPAHVHCWDHLHRLPELGNNNAEHKHAQVGVSPEVKLSRQFSSPQQEHAL